MVTLEQVMQLEGRELDAAVAERLGWKWATFVNVSILFPPYWYESEVAEHPALGWKPGKTGQPDYESAHFFDSRRNPPTTKPIVPAFSTDWKAAMRVRDWVRELDAEKARGFIHRLTTVVYARLVRENKTAAEYILLDLEPVDICRAALLLESLEAINATYE